VRCAALREGHNEQYCGLGCSTMQFGINTTFQINLLPPGTLKMNSACSIEVSVNVYYNSAFEFCFLAYHYRKKKSMYGYHYNTKHVRAQLGLENTNNVYFEDTVLSGCFAGHWQL
jgi:hypothetical protein